MAGSVDGDHGFQIAPMLDILFVLLLFFMVSAGAQKHETHLSTQIPGGPPPRHQSVPIDVNIGADGQVSVNSAPTDTPESHDLPETLTRLKAIVQSNATQPVIITPTGSTKHQRVVDVLDVCVDANVKNLAFGSPGD